MRCWERGGETQAPIGPDASDHEIQRVGSVVISDLLRRRRLH